MKAKCVLFWLVFVIVAGVAVAEPSPVTIGVSLPLSGPQTSLSREYIEGMLAAVSARNASGGIGGRQVELVILDDGFDSVRTRQNVYTLVNDWKAEVLLSCLPGSYRFVPEALVSLQVPLVGCLSTSPALRSDASGLVYFYRPDEDRIFRAAARKLAMNGVPSRLAIYHDPGAAGLWQAERARDAAILEGFGDIRLVPVQDSVQVFPGIPSFVLMTLQGGAMEMTQQILSADASTAVFVLEAGEEITGLSGTSVFTWIPFPLTRLLPDAGGFPVISSAVKRYFPDSRVSAPVVEGYVYARLAIQAIASGRAPRDAVNDIRSLDTLPLRFVPASPVREQYRTVNFLVWNGSVVSIESDE